LKKIYLDSSATTPVFPEAVRAMVDCMENDFGNPSSSHSFGRKAKKLLTKSREKIANLINSDEKEIVFTSGGTEADNLAIIGIADRYEKGHIITTAIEHSAVLATCKYLEQRGFRVTYLPVNEVGMISLKDLEKSICDDTLLISVMQGNNEVGTLQPVEEIGEIAKFYDIIFHVDAVQSLGKTDVDVKKINCDLLTCSSHKINGPKGIGALFVKRNTFINSILFGGGQENNIRSGTENMPGIVGFGVAAEITANKWQNVAKYTKELRDYFFDRLENEFSDIKINGSRYCRLPHNINFSMKDVDGFSMMLLLDSAGIAVSTGSACHSDSDELSHVLLAMGLSEEWINGTLRMTLGAYNTKEELDYVIDMLKVKRKLLIDAESLYIG
jgi:cysteine desulfurase